MDNFRQLKGFGWTNFSKMSLWRQDKGQDACVTAFLQSIEKGLPNPIPLNEVFEVARLSIQAAEGVGEGLICSALNLSLSRYSGIRELILIT